MALLTGYDSDSTGNASEDDDAPRAGDSHDPESHPGNGHSNQEQEESEEYSSEERCVIVTQGVSSFRLVHISPDF